MKRDKQIDDLSSNALKEAEMDCSHWKKLLTWATEAGDEIKMKDFKIIFESAQKKLVALQANRVTVHNHA